VDVTAMWKSIAESGRRTLRVRAVRLSMNTEKFAASFACSAAMDPDSSTTNRMSADERSESVTRSLPGCTRQWPTGLKL
jgi:hypothetical protein